MSDSYGVQKIAAERTRQIEEKGYDPIHDSKDPRSVIEGARAYIHHAIGLEYGVDLTAEECGWPWDEKFWKPGSPEQDLIKAGGMIAADLDVIEFERDLETL